MEGQRRQPAVKTQKDSDSSPPRNQCTIEFEGHEGDSMTVSLEADRFGGRIGGSVVHQ